MTREEALKILEDFPICAECDVSIFHHDCDVCQEALETARKALKGEAILKLINEREYIVKYSGDALQLLPDVMKELVRCKDCKHKEKDGISEGFHYCNVNGLQVTDDWFCADGAKDGEQE